MNGGGFTSLCKWGLCSGGYIGGGLGSGRQQYHERWWDGC